MATPVLMPRQGQSVESCIVNKWFKKKGDVIKEGDILFSYETDKATFDFESKVDGILIEVLHNEGEDVPVLTEVCIIGNEGEIYTQANQKVQNEPVNKEIVQSAQNSQEQKTAVNEVLDRSNDTCSEERIKISPRAKALAEKLGVDYRLAIPTGRDGRIEEKDVTDLKEKSKILTSPIVEGQTVKPLTDEGLALKGQESNYEEIKLTNIRKVIAKAMLHSISSTAQLTLNTSFDATDIIAFRKRIKESREKLRLENITLNDIIIYAVSRTILDFKDLNAHYLDDKMLCFKNANIGVAVDTEKGLMVPTVFNANLKTLNEISSEVRKLVMECQSGAISPELLKGGSFTITNLGTLGIESFTPVLNPPQTGILGVNTIIQRAREVNGAYEFYPAMGLSLTFDHRAIDGAPAARFLQELKNNLESFSISFVR